MSYQNLVISLQENFRGMSYGSWIATWSNWLLSEAPDYDVEGDVLFLRGNVSYRPGTGEGGQPRVIDPKGFYNRAGDLQEKISDATAICLPIMTAMYFIGDRYEGRVLENEEHIRYAARKDINEGGDMWATIMKEGDKVSSKIVVDLEKYRVESPLFKLIVSEKSTLLDFIEYPMPAGEYDAVTVGYFLIIKSLPISTYRIQIGGKGRGYYRTDAVYDITVSKKEKCFVRDISDPSNIYGTPPPNHGELPPIPIHPELAPLRMMDQPEKEKPIKQ
jgi:hypothetical protein